MSTLKWLLGIFSLLYTFVHATKTMIHPPLSKHKRCFSSHLFFNSSVLPHPATLAPISLFSPSLPPSFPPPPLFFFLHYLITNRSLPLSHFIRLPPARLPAEFSWIALQQQLKELSLETLHHLLQFYFFNLPPKATAYKTPFLTFYSLWHKDQSH